MYNKSNLKFSYILYLIFLISYFFFTIKPVSANIYKVEDVKIVESYDLQFNKENVIDMAFLSAFKTLISMIVDSKDLTNIDFNDLDLIKPMIETFSIKNEKFINDKYIANFNILFDKKSIFKYLNRKNIVSSAPIRNNLLFIPIFINLEKNEHYMFNQNNFYKYWNFENKKYFLLNYSLPDEDIEEFNLINKNISNIENYNFKEILKKYDFDDYIICILFYNENDLKVLSKIYLNKELSIINTNFKNININNRSYYNLVINNLKLIYENKWKSLNKINTSINLNIYLSLDANKSRLINRFEKELSESNMASKFMIEKITNKKIFYKIIYSNTPDKFISEFSDKNFKIKTKEIIWTVD